VALFFFAGTVQGAGEVKAAKPAKVAKPAIFCPDSTKFYEEMIDKLKDLPKGKHILDVMRTITKKDDNEIVDHLHKKFKRGFTREGKLDLTYLTNTLFSQMQYQNVSGFSLEKHKAARHDPLQRLREFKSSIDMQLAGSKFKAFEAVLDKNEWWEAQKDTLWSLATATAKDVQPYVFLSEAYKAGGLPSKNEVDPTNQNEFETYGPCPKFPKKCKSCRSNSGRHVLNTTCLPKNENCGPYHTYVDIKSKTGPVCRIVNVHMSSGNDKAVKHLVKFIEKHKDHDVPVFFGGDANVYYGGDNDATNIANLRTGLSGLTIPYTLVIAKHIVRKRRPGIFFNNAQAAYKFEVQAQDTMFFAYPTSLKDQVTINPEAFDRDFAWIKEGQPLAEQTMPSKVVDAFAGAAYGKHFWKGIIGGGKYKAYLEYLLSDHVPIYFDYADEAGSNYRVLFANTGSLIGARGVTNNKQTFGDNITFKDLKNWSKELWKPLLQGMIDLIKENRVVLENAGTMRTEATQWDHKSAGFQPVLDHAEKLLSNPNTTTTDFYKVLRVLSTKKWFSDHKAAQLPQAAAISNATVSDRILGDGRGYGLLPGFTRPMMGGGTAGKGDVTRRRRMAQRQFSDRRDSPVMVRLLQEIIDAQDD